ncbi:MAG: polyphosphate kinase 1 [Planctomycetes bacterium]|nr:polyphosphate kinase 1 [Planctomycetota bacterium]
MEFGPEHYCPKEISWLAFNARVLQEAKNPTTPLLERVKFLGIVSSNEDEFFRVRVSGLKSITEEGYYSPSLFGHSARKTLRKVQKIAKKNAEDFSAVIEEVYEGLKEEGIHIITDHEQIPKEHHEELLDYFVNTLNPYISAVLLDQTPTFPVLNEKLIYLAVELSFEGQKKMSYALVGIPIDRFPRFYSIKCQNGGHFVIFQDDIVRLGLNRLFARSKYTIKGAYSFKVTRDADVDFDDDLSESYIDRINEGLEKRKFSAPVRLLYDKNMPANMVDELCKQLSIDELDTIISDAKYHNYSDLMRFPDLGRTDLMWNKLTPLRDNYLDKNRSIFDTIATREVLLYYPFQTFDYFVEMLREAALDPNVISIRMTAYRLASDSRVVAALINAVRNGKFVEVVMELQARFDEKANVKWSGRLVEQGIKVTYGMKGLKVHAKICLIRRRENKADRFYAALGTGNFNESTSRLYTDHMLLTARETVTREVKDVFRFLENRYQYNKFTTLLTAPFNLRSRVSRMIEKEISFAQAGKKAYLNLKLNNLADKEIIDLLYKASQAGVRIRAIIRGMCSLIPGIPGVSENIEVISIVDRFLEHSRFYIFGNGGRPEAHLSSADWMTRNFDRRVEVAFPIRGQRLRQQLIDTFELQWNDSEKARLIDADLKNNLREATGPRSQNETRHYLKRISKK